MLIPLFIHIYSPSSSMPASQTWHRLVVWHAELQFPYLLHQCTGEGVWNYPKPSQHDHPRSPSANPVQSLCVSVEHKGNTAWVKPVDGIFLNLHKNVKIKEVKTCLMNIGRLFIYMWATFSWSALTAIIGVPCTEPQQGSVESFFRKKEGSWSFAWYSYVYSCND